jgi:hypothetical protein
MPSGRIRNWFWDVYSVETKLEYPGTEANLLFHQYCNIGWIKTGEQVEIMLS